jgi:hypothetical protein
MIFRYNFSEEFAAELAGFAKIHQYDDREDFKENWNNWLKENEELVAGETRRLQSLDYEGNIPDKMFKSARYYFRTKQKHEPISRKKYERTPPHIIALIDEFLVEDIHREDFTPKSSFLDFCEKYKDQDISKKTFKNRYFILSKTI